jgi:competence protein ComEC
LNTITFTTSRLHRLLTQWHTTVLLVISASLIWLSLRGMPDGRLHVYFLDVGQGDAIFIHAPDGRQILVDGGPSPNALLDELGDIMPFWDRSLDLVVLTHPDSDHMNGLLAAPARYHIKQVLDTGFTLQSADAIAWNDALAERSVARIPADQGLRLLVGDVILTVLSPAAGADSPSAGDNAASIVLRLDYGRTSVLLTGDASTAVEAEMLAEALPLDADILKAGHHGSADSSSEAFLAAVSPEIAVIQVGADNTFGHPAPAVLDRLQGVEVLRTDQDGRVEAISDGVEWQVYGDRRP